MRRLPPLPLILLIVTALVGWHPAAPPAPIVKGLAQLDWSAAGITDRAALDVGQWYAWGMGACSNPATWANCVPMNRNWSLAAQTYCPPVMLLGNEPTNPEPAGYPITPTLAASVTVSIESACPATALVAANIHLNNGGGEAAQWLIDYLAAYQLAAGHAFTHTLGIHCYAQWADTCLSHLRALADLPFEGQYWLTEFALYGPPPYTTGAELEKFLTGLPLALPNRIERAYIWTNRDSWPFDLVGFDGSLTPMGVVWAGWRPPTIRQTWLPAVYR